MRLFLLVILLLNSSFLIEAQVSPGILPPEPGAKIEISPELIEKSNQNNEQNVSLVKNNLPQNTYVVTNTADEGDGSLRKAIQDANYSSGLDLIQFNIAGTGVKIIQPLSPLPEILFPVIIDGSSQSGFTDKPLIEIDGVWTNNSDGIVVRSAGCTIKNIAVNRFNGVGIALYGNFTAIEGCFVGLDPDGSTKKGNQHDGIFILSANNQIGNPAGIRNIISGNKLAGIMIFGLSATGNKIQNTFIGSSFDGTSAASNELAGIYFYQAQQCTVGGSNPNEMNLISGNFNAGIRIEGGSSQDIKIIGNIIGPKIDGINALGNKHGIELIYGAGNAAGSPSNIIIGGKWAEERNIISGNVQAGIAFFLDAAGGSGNIVAGNLIGTTADGKNFLGNKQGIYIERKDTTNSLAGVKIGGEITDSGNVVSGNREVGIWINSNGARNNLIYGNYIGTSRPAADNPVSRLGNTFSGIYLDNAPSNRVGSRNPLHGNIIGDNGGGGIAIIGNKANRNFIINNFIGTDKPNGLNLGNRINGIYIEGSGNTAGIPGHPNEIAYNAERGIYIFSGNKNRIYFNSTHNNGVMGIDLAPFGISKNDSADVDTGANLLQNFAILDSVEQQPAKTIIHSTFNSVPLKQYVLHFFKNNKKSPSHFGEGQFYIDSVSFTTNDSGWAFLKTTLNEAVPVTQFISALVVDSDGNTSEYSRSLCLKDTDGDGIYDCWESQGDGLDINADGLIDLDLYSRGARPDHKDIFVEIDHMEGYKPQDVALQMLTKAFADIPHRYINNPDGEDGIKLIIEMNDSAMIPEIFPEDPWPRFFELKTQYFGTAFERQHPNSKYMLEAKKLIYRYCLWGHSFGSEGWSGIAELADGQGGNDLIVSLGKFRISGGDSAQQAGTFMHELGHTLGLHHGGPDDINYKPNYYSVMNYIWQFPKTVKGKKLNWELGYSKARLATLSENNLSESLGLNPSAVDYPDKIYFPYSDSNRTVVRIGQIYPNTGVDWDGNGSITEFASRPVDLNDLDAVPFPSPGELLTGQADWPNLKYNFRKSPDFRDPQPGLRKTNLSEYPEEMTPAVYDYIQSLPDYGVEPPVIVPPSIQWLGTLGGDESAAFGVSENGQVIVGYAQDSAYNDIAFRWTPSEGMQSLGNIGSYNSYWSEAKSISADGKIIVGWFMDSTNSDRAFKWTEETGLQDLGIGIWSVARAISDDGSTIVGECYDGTKIQAFRLKDGVVEYLGTLGGASSSASGVSSDGSVVVGYSYNQLNNPYAFRWAENPAGEGSVMQNIGTYYSFANAVSANGNYVTGFETGSAGRYRAFRWSVGSGLQLNIVGDFSEGTDLSSNGAYLVGYAGEGAFRLSKSGDLELYNDILKDSLTPGSDLYGLTAISSDARFAVGYGYNAATGRDEAFLLDSGGRLITSSSENPVTGPVSGFSLEQNYPNPFNPLTTIRYNIAVAGQVTITVFNILGQQVTRLVDEYKAAGRYEVKFDASRLASGVYLYNIQAGADFETRKMILLK